MQTPPLSLQRKKIMSALTPVRAFYDAVARGNVSAILAVLHPDLAWTEAEGFPYFSGTWRHPHEVVDKLLIPIGRDWLGFLVIPEEFLVDGDRVLGHGQGQWQADARS